MLADLWTSIRISIDSRHRSGAMMDMYESCS
jgi:hypothetical protein